MTDAALKERLRSLRQGLQPEAQRNSSPVLTSTTIKPDSNSDTDQLLFKRLRKLHSTDTSQASNGSSTAAPSGSTPTNNSHAANPRDEQDEIDALIQSTQDQLDLERSTSQDVLGSYDAESDHLSDSDIEQDIDAITRDAADIVNAVRDELALESTHARQSPPILAPSTPSQAQPTMVHSNREIEDALADASRDSELFTANHVADDSTQPAPAASANKARRNWLGGRFFFVAMLSLLIIAVSSVPGAHAFGAGNIPSFAYMEGKAFRHGDIEDILSELAKTAGHAAASGGLMGLAQSVFSAATGGSKFSSSDVQRVYFVCCDCAFIMYL